MLDATEIVPRNWWQDVKLHRRSIILAFVFLGFASLFDAISGTYVDSIRTVPVPDLILDAIPAVDLSVLFVWAWMAALAIMFLYPLIFKVEKFHVIIIQFSLLTMIRAAFTTFTHIQAPADAVIAHFPWPFEGMLYRNDLFFSGHVADMFIGFLVFDGAIKWFFLVMSVIMGATVLLMHVHYTIDVAAAFFIAFGSYHIGEWMLKQRI